jgi:hypothetical protein
MNPQSGITIIDVSNNGLGDVVVASWIAHSARAVNRVVQVNAHHRREVAVMLGVPDICLTSAEEISRSPLPSFLHLEYQLASTTPLSRFDAWCRCLGLPTLEPVRPSYCELAADGEWARQQWAVVDPGGEKQRVLLFPEAAWFTRMWPQAYYIDLANELGARGYAVAAMAGSQKAVDQMPCHWWGGFSVRQAAAMCRQADLVVANESGPAHLASVIGTPTVAICGPTDPALVFAHEANVRAVRIDSSLMPCVSCHFAASHGYRHACDVGGCQALMRLDPLTVSEAIGRMLTGMPHDRRASFATAGAVFNLV